MNQKAYFDLMHQQQAAFTQTIHSTIGQGEYTKEADQRVAVFLTQLARVDGHDVEITPDGWKDERQRKGLVMYHKRQVKSSGAVAEELPLLPTSAEVVSDASGDRLVDAINRLIPAVWALEQRLHRMVPEIASNGTITAIVD